MSRKFSDLEISVLWSLWMESGSARDVVNAAVSFPIFGGRTKETLRHRLMLLVDENKINGCKPFKRDDDITDIFLEVDELGQD